MGEKAKFWNFYLVLYSVYNLHLWTTILYSLGGKIYHQRKLPFQELLNSLEGIYSEKAGQWFRFAEGVQLATMMHHFLGIKKSSQIKFSHLLLTNLLLWGVLNFTTISNLLAPYILIRAFTETVRHLYNLYETVGAQGESQVAEFFRHSHFIITLVFEGTLFVAICLTSAPILLNEPNLSIRMPNSLNISFEHSYACVGLAIYALVFYSQFYAMLLAKRKQTLQKIKKRALKF